MTSDDHGAGGQWRPTIATARAAAGSLALIMIALIWRRPDLLVIATPLAVVAAWTALTRPGPAPEFTEQLGHPTIREGDASTWSASVAGGPEIDLVIAALEEAPWIETRPRNGVLTTAAVGGAAHVAVALRSTRWGRRPIERARIAAASPWAGFRWAVVGERHPLTTLPLPALFDVNASPRPSEGLVGLHRSSRSGDGNEFAGVRPFQPGDRMRRINWQRSVRSGELQVNSTLADLDSHVALLLDANDDVGVSEGVDGSASSLDLGVRAAASIAEHYAPRGERVSLRVFGAVGIHSLPAGTGRPQLRRILDTLAQVRPSDATGSSSAESALRRLRIRGDHVTVMLSPLIAPEALDVAMALGRRGGSVIVIDTLPDHVADDDDRYTALAWRIRLLERRQELRSVQAAGIPVVAWRGPGSLDQVIRDIGRRSAGPRMVLR